jgi:hypothetical protein
MRIGHRFGVMGASTRLVQTDDPSGCAVLVPIDRAASRSSGHGERMPMSPLTATHTLERAS